MSVMFLQESAQDSTYYAAVSLDWPLIPRRASPHLFLQPPHIYLLRHTRVLYILWPAPS